MSIEISDFYPGTTKAWVETISFTDGATKITTNPDITSDTVTFYLKQNIDDDDTEATLEKL